MIPFYEGSLPIEYDSILSQLSCGINGNSMNWKIVASIANLALGLFRFIFCSNNYTLLMHLLHFSSILMIYICSSGFLGHEQHILVNSITLQDIEFFLTIDIMNQLSQMSKRGCQHHTHKEKEETYRNVLLYPKSYAYLNYGIFKKNS